MTRPWLNLGLALGALFAVACERPSGAPGASVGSPTEGVLDAQPPPDPERVQFATADGWTLVGDLRLRRRGGTAVVLVHQLSSNRGEWASFAAQLSGKPVWQQPAGTVSTLTVDLRGHGESTSSPDGATRWQSFGNDRARWAGIEHDVSAAADYLRQRAGTTQIIVVGSSIGSTAGTLYAAREGSPVQGLVLLSPGGAYRGLEMIPPFVQWASRGRRALVIAASGDTYSADAARDLQSALRGGDAGAARVEFERYDNASAHGVALGAQGVHPELWARIERFVREF